MPGVNYDTKLLKKFFSLLTFLFVLFVAKGQTTDSASNSIPRSWDKFHIGLRVSAGIQNSFFTEVGLSLQKYIYEARHGFMVSTIYTAFEWTPSRPGQKPVNGIKAGAELVNNGFGGGFEIKYLFNSETEDLVFTPRLGLGLGFANLFYGYNISTDKYPFPKIGKHQFSLVVNTNIIFYHMKNKSH